MNFRWYVLFLAILATVTLTACGGSDNNDDEPPAEEQPGENEDNDDGDDGSDSLEVPTTYAFPNADDESTVSYTGQTKRHILIEDLTVEMNGLEEDAGQESVEARLNFYFRFDSATSDDITTEFNARDLGGMDILPEDSGELTYGAIADGKDLIGKIAGGDGQGNGEADKLIDDDFFGWEDGLDTDALPVDLVDYYFAALAEQATDGVAPLIETVDGPVPLDTVTVDAHGRDFRQLTQKFLLGAVAFSQGTNDYLQADFAAMLEREGDNAYTEGEHNWDEAFGYFGAARDYGDYTLDEIRNVGYMDSNNDDAIDIRSEFNFGNSTNCAKRDAGTADNSNPTDYTTDVFQAFLTGRAILREAAEAGELTEARQAELDEQIEVAALTWEQCVAATVVHYINDTVADLEAVEDGKFQDLAHFKDLAKHWSEMKGFALNLQFSPVSPFRADADSLADLKEILAAMGDAPVLADGTQAGVDFEGGVDQYVADLLAARALMQDAYGFDTENVENW
ncbi:DUF4856 domain-containing protein [Marinimicrobium agarilyticum]|uniref:DUF4856 domain-containing protein n=1 Tax=Marinimicrobium agarilyticum TaxID=306546 RepID=UPI0004005D70|nr:DUF4856 domain-containing protein [Marinimicrobium agarilyticum]